ncbi:YceI family protein [Haloechinothrix sp. YIM 98757]|uniref:YceI family protein n=1 Tax=Haloechinothrix aidingensis TaxID=2752311 RepID=A0A838AA79_9PSEU|nr:YceI family protein [Haloechinothrix aidingensis]MBA0126042.1 YceI family protein [Haloechinothrix aidingensis]
MTTATTALPTGTWVIDPAHSEVTFKVRHLGLARVRGEFTAFRGQIVTGESVTDSTVTAEIDVASLDTGNENRDQHVRSADFFDAENHPTMSFRSVSITPDGDAYRIDGEISWRGYTVPVSLHTEFHGVGQNPANNDATTLGASAEATINRLDFGVGEPGNAMLSEQVKIILEIEAALQS